MEFNTFKAVPAMFNDICRALYWGSIQYPPQRHLPVSEDNIWVFGVMHRQGVNRNIHIYFQIPPSRLHPYIDGAPSTDVWFRSLCNELALDMWSHMSSMRRQKYTLIFAAHSIVDLCCFNAPSTGTPKKTLSNELALFITTMDNHGSRWSPVSNVRHQFSSVASS